MTEVVTLIGSKEGIAHFPLAFINPGDYALMTSPGYPVYFSGTLFAGGRSYFLPLRKENHFLPDLSQIPEEMVRRGQGAVHQLSEQPHGGRGRPFFF